MINKLTLFNLNITLKAIIKKCNCYTFILFNYIINNS